MTCMICQEDVTDDTVTLQCGHEYCSDCILGWTAGDQELRACCPVCRAPVASRFEQDAVEDMNPRHFRLWTSANEYAKLEQVIATVVRQNTELYTVFEFLKKDVARARKNYDAVVKRLAEHNKQHSAILRRNRSLNRDKWQRKRELHSARQSVFDLFPVTNIVRVRDQQTPRTQHSARRSQRLLMYQAAANESSTQ